MRKGRYNLDFQCRKKSKRKETWWNELWKFYKIPDLNPYVTSVWGGRDKWPKSKCNICLTRKYFRGLHTPWSYVETVSLGTSQSSQRHLCLPATTLAPHSAVIPICAPTEYVRGYIWSVVRGCLIRRRHVFRVVFYNQTPDTGIGGVDNKKVTSKRDYKFQRRDWESAISCPWQ